MSRFGCSTPPTIISQQPLAIFHHLPHTNNAIHFRVTAASDRIDGSTHFCDTELLDGRFRSNPILDTLASICVRKGKGEVYAVAMQLHENKDGSAGGKLTLTIAGNSGVPPELYRTRKVWSASFKRSLLAAMLSTKTAVCHTHSNATKYHVLHN